MIHNERLLREDPFEVRLKNLQSSPSDWNAFLVYTERRKVRETVGFFIWVDQYQESLLNLARKIWDRYRNSSNQLNLSPETYEKITKNLNCPSIAMFRKAQKEIESYLIENVLPKYDKSTEILQKDYESKLKHFERLLHNAKSKKKFLATAKKLDAGPQVKFWCSIEHFENCVLSQALNIWDNYISPDSSKQINIPGTVLDSLKNKMASPDTETFNEAKKEIRSSFVYDVMPEFEEYLDDCRKDGYPAFNYSLRFPDLAKKDHKKIRSSPNLIMINSEFISDTSDSSTSEINSENRSPSNSNEYNQDYGEIKKFGHKILGEKHPVKRTRSENSQKHTAKSRRKVVSLLGEYPKERNQLAPQLSTIHLPKLKKILGADFPIPLIEPTWIEKLDTKSCKIREKSEEINNIFLEMKEKILKDLEDQRELFLEELNLIDEGADETFLPDENMIDKFKMYGEKLDKVKEEIIDMKKKLNPNTNTTTKNKPRKRSKKKPM